MILSRRIFFLKNYKFAFVLARSSGRAKEFQAVTLAINLCHSKNTKKNVFLEKNVQFAV